MNAGESTKCGIGRRTFVYGVSAIGAVALAGCLGDDDDVDVDDDEPVDDTDPPTDEDDTEPEEESEGETEIDAPDTTVATVEVDYDGEWSGAIETLETREDYEGEGPESFDVEFDPEYDVITAWFQKLVAGDESREISVRVLVDDEVVIEERVDGEYGMVRVDVEIT